VGGTTPTIRRGNSIPSGVGHKETRPLTVWGKTREPTIEQLDGFYVSSGKGQWNKQDALDEALFMRDRSSQKSSPQTETGLLLNLTTATIFFYVQGAELLHSEPLICAVPLRFRGVLID
jgi:hypothetical protein